jgi:Co/Zn/Cd efflux system component
MGSEALEAPDIEANGTTSGDTALAAQRQSIATANAALPASKTLSRRTRRALSAYYARQTNILDEFEIMDALHRGHPPPEDVAAEALARRALNLSFASNVILLGVRMSIAIVSGSLSLIIATVDAVLDVLSSAMMYYASHAAKRKEKYKYPVGRHRLEPLGVVIFSSVMATAAWTVIIEGIRQLAAPGGGESFSTTQLWIVVGGSIFVMIFKMGLFLYCRRSKNVAVSAFATE